jgi:hypothetical protein
MKCARLSVSTSLSSMSRAAPSCPARARRRGTLVGLALGGALLAAGSPVARAVTPVDPCRLVLRDPGRMLDRSISPAQLARSFASEDLRASAVDVGEGETRPGTLIFPDDARRRLSVVWADRARPGQATWLLVEGESQWRGYRDIGLGTDLRTLERLNGRPFVLAGFDWDYSGTVTDWRGGRLGAIATERCRLIVRLAPPPNANRDFVHQVAGGRDFPSDHPAMRALNPAAYQLILELP